MKAKSPRQKAEGGGPQTADKFKVIQGFKLQVSGCRFNERTQSTEYRIQNIEHTRH